jgi:ABC-type transport system involved in multi-copper enzyme maturation permease subunit
MPLISIPDWLNAWATPLWLLGLGCIAALIVLSCLYGLARLLGGRWSERLLEGFGEGVLVPVTWVVSAFAVIGLLASFVVRDRDALFASLLRVPFTGTVTRMVVVPAVPEEGETTPVPVAIPFQGQELQSVQVKSENDLRLFAVAEGESQPNIDFGVTGGEEKTWDRLIEIGDALAGKQFLSLQLENRGESASIVELKMTTQPRHPQAVTILHFALTVLLIYLAYLLLRAFFPKLSAISLATSKSQMAQPLYQILLVVCCFLLGLFLFVPYHTFGEDIKVMKDTGLTLILVCAVLQAVWAASTSVEDEIEGKTAMTVLSKPIGRAQFIIGKFAGISWASAVFMIVTGAWLMVLVAYKTIYDARETANPTPEWQQCHAELVRLAPGLALALMETLIFIAISVAISTRLPLLANMTICFAIYAFGHLTPQLVQAGEGRLENVKFMAQFIATVLPVLDHFNIQAAIAKGVSVNPTYVVTASGYCVLYCTIALLLALVLFEDRDLA